MSDTAAEKVLMPNPWAKYTGRDFIAVPDDVVEQIRAEAVAAERERCERAVEGMTTTLARWIQDAASWGAGESRDPPPFATDIVAELLAAIRGTEED